MFRLRAGACLMLLFLCAAGSAGAASPLGGLVIQRSDLRAGYKLTVARYTRAPLLQNGNPIDRAALARHGFLIAYQAQFDDSGPRPQPMLSSARLAEYALHYRDSAGARWGFQQTLRGLFEEARPLRMATVGDQSAWFTSFLPEPPPYEVVVYFRRGSYLVWIALDDRSYRRGALLQLAQLVDRRIVTRG